MLLEPFTLLWSLQLLVDWQEFQLTFFVVLLSFSVACFATRFTNVVLILCFHFMMIKTGMSNEYSFTEEAEIALEFRLERVWNSIRVISGFLEH